jgi:NodT family efflux transporter outer membrane factor (OMF) lipoprotein
MNLPVRWSNTGRKKRAIAIACIFLLALSSCGIPDLRPPAPAPALPGSFDGVTSKDNSAQVRIEEFFNDPLLTKLICQALVGNQELRILNEDVQIASNEILARQGAYLPFLSPGATAGLNKYSSFSLEGAAIRDDVYRPGKFFPNPLSNFVLGPILFWTPDIWGQLHNLKDAAAFRYYATAEGRNAFVTRLVAEIADNYYQLIAFDKRLQNLNDIIALQERSLGIAQSKFEAARGSDLPVQRFLAAVRENQSQRLIVYQDIVRVQNQINFLAGRFPQLVARMSGRTIDEYIDLQLHSLSLGVPAQLLLDRPDIRQAERELAATGLDVLAARKRFYPQGFVSAGVGYQAFNPRYLFLTPEALVGNIAGNLLVPLINRKAIKADYLSANARQLQAVYNYQRVLIEAVTDVITRMSKVQKYGRSIEIKKQQVAALVRAVQDATDLYMNPRLDVTVDYLDVLTAQNALFDARRDLIDIKQEQLSAVVNTYQALGGGAYLFPILPPKPLLINPWSKHLKHPEPSPALVPPPGPLPILQPGRGPKPPQAPPAVRGPEPPPTPTAERGPFPAPAPAAEGGQEPAPTPDSLPALPPPVVEPDPPRP